MAKGLHAFYRKLVFAPRLLTIRACSLEQEQERKVKSQQIGLAFLNQQGASLSMHQSMPRSMQQTSVSRLILLASVALFEPGPVQGQSSKYLQYQCNPSARECARRMLDVRGEPLLMAEEHASTRCVAIS